MKSRGPKAINPSYEWFLNVKHDAAWIKREFGDTFVIRSSGRK